MYNFSSCLSHKKIQGILILLFSCASFAHAADELSEDHFFDDVPVVLHASRLSQAFNESPVPVTIIDREMIDASGFTEISDVFRLVPGFVSDYYRGNTPLVGYLSVSDSLPRRMQVMVDGRSFYSPVLGGPIWSSLPLNMEQIERIEVVRGPNAAAHGSNAFLGVINIVTRAPGTHLGWTTKVIAGDPGLLEGSVQYEGRADKVAYRFSGWYEQNDGFDNLHDGKRMPKFSSRVDYQVNNSDHLIFQVGVADGDLNRDEPDGPYTPDHEVDLSSNFQLIRWNRTVDESNSFYVQFYRNQDETLERVTLDFPGIGDVPINQDFASSRYDLEFQYNQALQPGLDIAWGGSLRRDRMESDTYLGRFNPINVNISRLFTHAFWNINEQFFINAGVMVEDADISSTHVLPLLSLHYRIDKSNTLRLSATRGSRNPTAFEEYSDTKYEVPDQGLVDQVYFNNEDLEAETINTINFGLVGNNSEYQLTYDLSLSRHRIKNLITRVGSPFPVATSPPDAIDNINFSANYYTGGSSIDIDNFEAAVKYLHTRKTDIMLSYAYTKIKKNNIFIRSQRIIDSAPKHLFSLLATHELGNNYKLSGGYYYSDDIKYVDSSNLRPTTDRVDMRLSRKLKFANADGEVALVGQDLLNNYQGIYKYNRMDRRFYLSLKLHFN